MTTSGSIALTFTRDEIIQEAAEQLGVTEPAVALPAAQVTSWARTLNNMLKAWQNDGLHIHSVKRAYLFPNPGEYEYNPGAAGFRYVDYYYETTFVTSYTSTNFDVADATNINVNDIIGLYKTDGTMHWTTAAAVSAPNVTINDAIVGSIDVGAIIYNWPTAAAAERPMKIVEAWERNYQGNDRPVRIVSRKEYSDLTLKDNEGALVHVFYDPQVGDNATLFTWPANEDPRSIIGMWIKRTFESFTADTDEVDLPQEAFEAVAFNLAMRCITKAGVSDPGRIQMVVAMANQTREDLFDKIAGPEGSVYFQPDMRGWG